MGPLLIFFSRLFILSHCYFICYIILHVYMWINVCVCVYMCNTGSGTAKHVLPRATFEPFHDLYTTLYFIYVYIFENYCYIVQKNIFHSIHPLWLYFFFFCLKKIHCHNQSLELYENIYMKKKKKIDLKNEIFFFINQIDEQKYFFIIFLVDKWLAIE